MALRVVRTNNGSKHLLRIAINSNYEVSLANLTTTLDFINKSLRQP